MLMALVPYPPPTKVTIPTRSGGDSACSAWRARRTTSAFTSTATPGPPTSNEASSAARVIPSGTSRACPLTQIVTARCAPGCLGVPTYRRGPRLSTRSRAPSFRPALAILAGHVSLPKQAPGRLPGALAGASGRRRRALRHHGCPGAGSLRPVWPPVCLRRGGVVVPRGGGIRSPRAGGVDARPEPVLGERVQRGVRPGPRQRRHRERALWRGRGDAPLWDRAGVVA